MYDRFQAFILKDIFFSSVLTFSLLWSSCALSKQLLLHFHLHFLSYSHMARSNNIPVKSHSVSYTLLFMGGNSGALNTRVHNIGRENDTKILHFRTWSKWAIQHLTDLDIQRPEQWSGDWMWMCDVVYLQYFLAKMYHEWERWRKTHYQQLLRRADSSLHLCHTLFCFIPSQCWFKHLEGLTLAICCYTSLNDNHQHSTLSKFSCEVYYVWRISSLHKPWRFLASIYDRLSWWEPQLWENKKRIKLRWL